MHTVSPYSIRCFNPALTGVKHEEKYSILDKVGPSDALDVIHGFMESHRDNYSIVEDSKQIYRFADVACDKSARTIHGWLLVGGFGRRTEIINVDTGTIDFQKAERHADVVRHFFYFHLPLGCNEGVALMHAYRGNGVKTLFLEQFQAYFTSLTTRRFQMNVLTYEKAFAEWREANAKEIRVVKFSGLSDITDQLKKLGHDEKEIVLKAPRRGALGKLDDFFNKDTEQSHLIEMLLPQCSEIKALVDLNGKKRTFRVGTTASHGICDIEIPDSVKMDGGNPERASIQGWCAEIVSEFSANLYPIAGTKS